LYIRESDQQLRGYNLLQTGCHIQYSKVGGVILLFLMYMHANDSFYEEPEHVFEQFPKYHIKTVLGDFNAKTGRDIFKPTIRIETLHKISNDNGIRAVNSTTPKKSSHQEYNVPKSQHSYIHLDFS